jgi:predicted ABC-type ATPase
VHLYFLWVSRVDLALRRVEARALSGGHDVLEAVVRRRFDRSIRNFLTYYRKLADSCTVFDNSGATPTAIAFEKEGKLRIIEPQHYDQLMARYKGK